MQRRTSLHFKLEPAYRLGGSSSFADASGQLSGITYPSGRIVNYVYNSNNQVSQMTTTVGGTTQTLASNIAYFPFGGVKSFTFGNGANYTRGFDTDGRLASYTLYTQTINLGYDPASRITSATDAANSADTKTYAYDSLDRLTAFTAPTTNQGYGYDATGNRTSLSIGANNYSNTIAPTSNRLTASTGPIPKTFSFDNNGSVTADGINQFSYDARGRLIQAITPAGNVDYGINALGQRVTKTVGTVSTIYHYDLQGHMIAESDAQGTLKQETIYLDNIPLAVMTAHVYYIYTDQLNTPRLITDESNNPVWRWDNTDPFANNPPNDDPNGTGYHFTYNQRYPGQYFDVETNTHYNYYRDHYFPDLGRYGQSDPIGLWGGINTYAYVGGSPLMLIDPYGLLTEAAQKIVDIAMSKHCGNTFDAYSDVLSQRDQNRYNPALRDAEHYLFARDWTKSTHGAATLSLVPAIVGYSTVKALAGPLAGPGKWWDTSNASWSEMGAGLEGTAHGVNDVMHSQNTGESSCSCFAK